MKREIFLALLIMLSLTGCAKSEDPYRVDTVVYIPADPTEAPTEAAVSEETAAPEMTEAASTEPEAATETEPEATEAIKKTTSSSQKTTSSKKSSSNKTTAGNKNTGSTATKPAGSAATKPTEPTQTKPAQTQPVETKPPATEPPVTEPPQIEPPQTEPPTTVPAETEPEPTDPPLYDISGYSVGGLETAMANAINAYRAEEGLGELSLSSRLCAIASCRGYEISQVWSHTRPDGRSYGTVLSDYGYGGSARELLVYVSGSGDGQSIVDKWMASDSHKELLLGGYSTVGIGVYRAGGYTYIVCLLV